MKSPAELVAEYEKRMAEVLAAEKVRRGTASDKTSRLRAQRLAKEIGRETDPSRPKRRK
jgi:hypothetical protein